MSSQSSAPTAANTSSAVADDKSPGVTYYPPSARAPAPKIDAVTLRGGHLALANLGGAVIVLNVWASWCIECRAESRSFAQLSIALRATGHVRFVGVDEQDVASRARFFVAVERVDYPQLVDRDGTLLAKLTMLPSGGIPSTLVIDSTGLVAGRIIGVADASRLRRLVRRVAEGH